MGLDPRLLLSHCWELVSGDTGVQVTPPPRFHPVLVSAPLNPSQRLTRESVTAARPSPPGSEAGPGLGAESGLRHRNQLEEGGSGSLCSRSMQIPGDTRGRGLCRVPLRAFQEGHSELCSAAFKKLASGGVRGPAVNPF